MTTEKIFPIRLKELRLWRCMTQSDLALITGLKPSAISHFENGRRLPSLVNFKKLANGLHVTADQLLLEREAK